MLKEKDKIGKLTLIKRQKRIQNNKEYWFWYCKCKCGNFKWIREQSLIKKNPTQSCGCLGKETQFKKIDLTGKKFNMLTVVEFTGAGEGYNEEWLCKCKCGNTIVLTRKQIDSKLVKSCGCQAYEVQLENQKKAFNKFKEKNLVEKTSLAVISREELMKTNTSGITGVSWDKSRNKWKAEIVFQGKTHFLGRRVNKEDAIKLRKDAEEKYFKPVIEKFNKEKGDKDKR